MSCCIRSTGKIASLIHPRSFHNRSKLCLSQLDAKVRPGFVRFILITSWKLRNIDHTLTTSIISRNGFNPALISLYYYPTPLPLGFAHHLCTHEPRYNAFAISIFSKGMGSHVASSEGLRHSSLGNDSVSEHLVRGLIEYTCSSGNCRALQQALVSRPDDSQPPSGPALKQTKNPPATGEKSSKSTTSCTKRRFASAENTPPSLGFDFQEHEDFVVAYQSPIVRPNCASQFRRKVDGLAARICGSLKIHPPLPPRASTLGNRVARSFLASPIESLDGQSPLDSSNAEVFTDQSPPNVAIASRDVVTPSTSCFLVKESLKHRLRPSQRIPRVDRIARPDMDRYVLRHPAHPDLRDRLLMGKPRESQAEHNLPQSLAGSANNPFRRSGNARRVNASGERVTTGRNDRRNSIRDSNALEHHQQLFASINQPFDLPNPWNRAVFSGVGSRDHNWPGQSVAFSAVPTFFPSFLKTVSAEDDCKTYEDRLALACDVDRTKHLMSPQSRSAKHQDSLTVHRVSDEEAPVWRDNAWLSQSMSSSGSISHVRSFVANRAMNRTRGQL